MNKIILLTAMFLLSGCLRPDSKDRPRPSKQNTIITDTSSVSDTVTQRVIKEHYTRDNFKLSFNTEYNLLNNQTFLYNNKGIKDHSVTFKFNESEVLMTLTHANSIWYKTCVITESWKHEFLSTTSNRYSNTIKDPMGNSFNIIIISNKDNITKITVGDITYLKSPENTTKVDTSIKYGDNHQVVVGNGDFLNKIILKYNKDNGTNYDIQYVLEKNPNLKNRKNYILKRGEIINF